VQVRDVIEDDPCSFDIYKLESEIQPGTVVMMRLRCGDEEEKDDWVKAIVQEVKQIREEAKKLLLGSWIA
jgi:hypothetical protein